MKRSTGATVLLAAVSGCMAPDTDNTSGQYMAHAWNRSAPDGVHWGVQSGPPTVASVMGPDGRPVPMAAPYTYSPPTGEAAARAMLAKSVPLDLIQQAGFTKNGAAGPEVLQAQGMCPPGGCPPGMPPGGGLAPPGVPPLPGMVPPGMAPGMPGLGPPSPPGAVAALGALTRPVSPFPVQRTEVRFAGPAGMKISWYAPRADGRPGFSSQYLEAPARYNFLQASVYRLKLTDIPNRPGLELYPTLEVVPAKAKTCSFLAHSAVPVSFTDADFDQVAAGNYVVKVIYLPDPQFQDLAATGIDELVSSQLEPGVDPIAEAQRRGSILLVIRLGNIDLEAPNTPAMDAPNPFCPPPQRPPAARPLPPGMGQGPGPLVPYTTVSRPPMMGLPSMLPPPGAMPPGGPLGGVLPGTVPAVPPDNIPPSVVPPAQPVTPGVPVGKFPTTGSTPQVQYKVQSAPRPTVAELAGQPTTWTSANNK